MHLKIRCVWLMVLLTLFGGAAGTLLAESQRWFAFGPGGAFLLVLEIDPQNPKTLYTGFLGGVFKSIDGGANWRRLSDGNAPSEVLSLQVDPHDSHKVYAGNSMGIFKSVDEGMSWATITPPFPEGFGQWILKIHPKNPNIIYAGSAGEDGGTGGLFRSIDGGSTWSRTSLSTTPWGTVYVYALAVDPEDTAVLYAGTNAGSYRSTDGGAAWVRMLESPNALTLTVAPDSPGTLYVGGPSGFFKSTDYGSTWSTPPDLEGRSVDTVSVDPHTGTVYTRTRSGLFKSMDRGASWSIVSSALANADRARWDPKTPGIVYYTAVDGLFKSIDGGISARRLSSGLVMSVVNAVAADLQNPGSVYAITNQVFKSTDGARRWQPVSWSIPVDGNFGSIAIDAQNSRIIYLTKGGGVYKSTDAGLTWSSAGAGLTASSINKLVIDPQNSTTVYAMANLGLFTSGFVSALFKSTDSGTNWRRLGSSELPATTFRTFLVNPHNPWQLYVGGNGGLYESNDGGDTWIKVNLPVIGGLSVLGVAIDFYNRDIVYVSANCGLMFESTDAGISWSRTNLTVESCVYGLMADPLHSGIVYALTTNGLWKTVDAGASWALENEVARTLVTDLAIERNSGKVYAATYGAGVFATFDDVVLTPIPVLTLDSTECIGQSWTLGIRSGSRNAKIRLLGNSNGRAWEIAEWSKTDENGAYEEKGTFLPGTKGRHTLYVEIDGATSNDVSFDVSTCQSN